MCVTKSARQDFLAGIFSFGLQEVNKFINIPLRKDLVFTNIMLNSRTSPWGQKKLAVLERWRSVEAVSIEKIS